MSPAHPKGNPKKFYNGVACYKWTIMSFEYRLKQVFHIDLTVWGAIQAYVYEI